MAMSAPAYYTAEMVRGFPEDGNRYEVVYGELLVTPAPRHLHQRLVHRLAFALEEYVRRHPVGEVLFSPADISWDEDMLVQPDVFVVPIDEARHTDWTAIRHLLLVAEVLSPSSTRQDRFIKRRRYQEGGVPLYWIVDADAEQVEVWTPADLFPRIEREHLMWQPTGTDQSFELELRELFRPL